MSSEWTEVAIGQVCEITSSKRVFAHEYVEKGVPFYGSKEVIDKALGTYSDTTVFISDARFFEIATKFGYPIKGDLLLSSVGNRAGIPYVINDEGKFYFKDGNLTWFRKFKGLNSHFLCHWMKSTIGQSALNSIMIGSAQKALTITNLSKLRISLPSLWQQESIAATLNVLDDRITLLRETNATLEAIAQALFKSWFVDFDPVRAKLEGRAPEGMDEATAQLFPDSFEESELGLAPRGWRVGTVGDFARQHKGSINPLQNPKVMYEHFSLPAFDNQQMPVSELGTEIKSNKTSVPPDAVLLSKLNPHIPRIWLPVDVGNHAVCSTEFLVFVPAHGSRASKEFIYCAFTTAKFKELLCQLVTGTSNSHQRVKPDGVSTMITVIPSEVALEAFGSIAKPIFERIGHNRSKAQTLAALRDTLLPRLISGQLRLPEAQATFDAALA